MLARLISDKIRQSPKSVLLLGPRQVGKSSLILSLNPDLVINLHDDRVYLDFKSNPNELRERIQAQRPSVVFIDEIQRHTSLLNTVQVLIDSPEYKGRLKFYITGSSARKLRRGQANLLPGRLLSYEIGPLCGAELDYKLDVQRALSIGCLPEPYLTKDQALVEKLLSTYSGVYLKEEIQAEALTRDLGGFSRFIMAAAQEAGQILDFSKLAKQAKIERRACARFYEILEDTLIARRLEVFDQTDAEIKRRPKFYFFDTGVLNGLLENFVASLDRKGHLFEHLVVNQITASAQARDLPIRLSYFRTRSGYEVDLVLQIRGHTYAIEVKSGQVGSQDVRSLERFKDYFPQVDRLFIVTPTSAHKKIDEVEICDLNQLLMEIGL